MTETLNETEQGDEQITGPAEDAPQEPDEPGVSDDEAAEEEDAEQGDDEPEVEPPPAPDAANEVLQEEHFNAAGKRAKNYMKAVVDVLGESAQDLDLCPRCTDFLPGWILPLAIKPVDDEQKRAVKMSIGELVEADYKQDTHSQVCPDCNGEGSVKTGSKVPKQRTARCLSCDGRGWIGPRSARTDVAPPPAAAANGGTPEPTDDEKPVQDPWGRFIDDPLYGVMPGFERD